MMRLIKLTEDVYTCLQEDLAGWGYNNTGFIKKGGGIVIDTMWDLNFTQRMLDLFATISSPPYRYLINTHANGDHCWGNQLLSKANIIAHSECAKFMKTKSNPERYAKLLSSPTPTPGILLLKRILREFAFSGISIVPPNIIIENNLDIELDGLKAQIIYVGPAHTSGDLIVYLPYEGIVFAGDVIFSQCTPVGWNGTLKKWLAALDFIVSLEPKYIVPGHGPICGLKEIEQNKEYLKYIFEKAYDCHSKGMNELETIQRISHNPYSNWPASERLVMNIFWAYREFDGDLESAPDIFDMFEYIHEMRLCNFDQ